jgi:chemotaxis protein methyltransferase CheR
MTVRDVFPDTTGWDIRILATDIDSDVLAFGDAAVYPAERLERVPAEALKKGWQPCFVDGRRHYEAKDVLRRLITFKQLNLHEAWPMQGPFDVIFCRNVVIYFDAEAKSTLVRRFHEILKPEGRLFLGHSESLVSLGLGFVSCGQTAYRKATQVRDKAAVSL